MTLSFTMQPLLTLSEFAAVAAQAVKASGAAPDNRQAKPIPAERMVRYYTARGLLPRPGSRGRALMYGRTHLLRLVAIKRLQGQGLSLDAIAQRLEGMPPAELESLAAIPPGVMPADLGDAETVADSRPSRTAGQFWATAPDTDPVDAPTVETPAPAPHMPTVIPLGAVRLSETVTLLIHGDVSRLPALGSLRRAAMPLLDLLATDPDGATGSTKDDR